jgi:hypothetical protein
MIHHHNTSATPLPQTLDPILNSSMGRFRHSGSITASALANLAIRQVFGSTILRTLRSIIGAILAHLKQSPQELREPGSGAASNE